ncbi:dihydrofolate reductase family protein [Devosia sp.]|uniref:dihydrofolate reductase family protein n=1 Tax=Devosia sp. TaxID=1871048 RepID=UPI0035B06666
MRKVTAGYFHSVDGVVQSPNLWQFDAFDDELGEMLGTVMQATDTVLMGRVGYSEWAGYWPTATMDGDFATFINSVPKFVASRTLSPADMGWSNSKLIVGDLLEFVRALKARDGGDIAVMGGISVARQLFFAGLLDSLTLITHPVVAGAGMRMFEPTDPVTRLELRDCRRTSKGNVVTSYGLRSA